MSVEDLLTRGSTIVSVTQTTDTDEYGNPQTSETRTTAPCYFEPFARSVQAEQNVDRSTTSDDWLYVVAAGTSLASVDHVEVDGESGTFEVVGDPANIWNPRRRETSHIEARLRRTTR